MSKKRLWLLLLLAAAFFVTISYRQGLSVRAAELQSLPEWIMWNEKTVAVTDQIKLSLSEKSATIYNSSGKEIWKSGKEIFVQDAIITDLDRDNDEELILLLWKIGRYGKAMPFWVTDDEDSFSQHIFIYDIEEENVRQKWCASDIGMFVRRMKLMEKNNAVILTEDLDDNCSLWTWKGFGLKNIDNGVKFIAFGDNIIHKTIYEHAFNHEAGSFDFLYKPFLKEINSADIASIQAETILVDKKAAVSGYPFFGSPLEVGEAIKKAGFDIAVCGNNHALDKGIYGIDVTTDFYNDNDIAVLGIQNSKDKEYRPYEVFSKNGIKLALFSYTYGTGEMDASERYPYAVHYFPKTEEEKKRLMEDIKKARNEADFVVVYAHWGDEYKTEISDYQKEMTELLANAGADVVIGTHPHVLQKYELLKRPDGGDMLVYYSLGNFRADQKMSDETKVGGEALFTIKYTYDGIKITDYSLKKIDAIY